MPHVRPLSTVEDALHDSDAGMRDADNAAKHGVSIKTIRRWRRRYRRQGLPRGQLHTSVPCPRCEAGALDAAAHSELLGWYFGDGHLSVGRRDVFNLHIYNDAKYSDANERLAGLMVRVKPGGRPHARRAPGCVITTISWKHWPCLLPQHGPGRKNERPIVLETWQKRIVERHAAGFLRGLFHSDGCRVINTTKRSVAGRPKTYPRVISVSRREAVAALDALIGPKS